MKLTAAERTERLKEIAIHLGPERLKYIEALASEVDEKDLPRLGRVLAAFDEGDIPHIPDALKTFTALSHFGRISTAILKWIILVGAAVSAFYFLKKGGE